MPNLSSKKVLYIDLSNKSYEVKNHPDLHKYIGGIGVGLKLLQSYIKDDPLVFAVGPLNGFFPYCSKTAIVLDDKGVAEDLYIGGRLNSRIKFTGLDAIVINGEAKTSIMLDISNEGVVFKEITDNVDTLGLPGKRTVIQRNSVNVFLDDYFYTPESILLDKFNKKNIDAIVFTGSETYKIQKFAKYNKLYNDLLGRVSNISITKGDNPSCFNCPMGCDRAKFGEIGGNVLLHSLVACQYAEKIYSDVGIIFSCLNVLGYDYTHEDIESLPKIIEETLKGLS